MLGRKRYWAGGGVGGLLVPDPGLRMAAVSTKRGPVSGAGFECVSV